jgi:hypothetical protein
VWFIANLPKNVESGQTALLEDFSIESVICIENAFYYLTERYNMSFKY